MLRWGAVGLPRCCCSLPERGRAAPRFRAADHVPGCSRAATQPVSVPPQAPAAIGTRGAPTVRRVLAKPSTLRTVSLPTASAPAGADARPRCPWAVGELYERYHDEEWGTALHGDRALFERITLEGFQSGLSWIVVLRKRPAFRGAFAGFDPDAVAAFGGDEVERLLADPGIIRNRMKIESTVGNARALVALRQRDGDGALDRLIWSFAPAARAEHVPPQDATDVQPTSSAAKALAKALKAEGFRFVGPTTVYAMMQAVGVVDDHLAGCWRAERR